MDALEWSKKGPYSGPPSFCGIAVDLTDAIAIIGACPRARRVGDSRMRADNMVVARVLICVTWCSGVRKAMHVGAERRHRGIIRHAQAHPAGRPSDSADHGRTIIGVRAASSAFVCPPTRWIKRVEMFITFFPPHSETFHQSPSEHLEAALLAADDEHCVANRAGVPKPWCNAAGVRQPAG